MPYIGSYVWKIRKKVGHDLLVLPSVDIIAVREDGALMMVYNKDFAIWVFPGGYVEESQNSEMAAVRELREEAGLETSVEDLIPFAYQSGHEAHYKNGDITQPFTQTYLTKKFRDTCEKLDEAEVASRKWFLPDKIREMKLEARITKILEAYEEFSRTGKYQIIHPKEKNDSRD